MPFRKRRLCYQSKLEKDRKRKRLSRAIQKSFQNVSENSLENQGPCLSNADVRHQKKLESNRVANMSEERHQKKLASDRVANMSEKRYQKKKLSNKTGDHVKSHLPVESRKRGAKSIACQSSAGSGGTSRQKKKKSDHPHRKSTTQTISKKEKEPIVIDPNVKVKKEKERFLVAKVDMDKKTPFLWRVKETNMLQRFESYEQEGIILYRSTYTYAAWDEVLVSNYVTAIVRIVSYSRTLYIVEYLGPDVSETIENPTPEVEAPFTKPLRGNFEVFLQTPINPDLGPNFLTEITNENDDFFRNNIKEISEERKPKLIKDYWNDDLTKSVNVHPSMAILDSGECEMDRERYRNPPAPLGYQNLNPPDIVRRASDTQEIQINFQKWIALSIFEDEDVSIYDHFAINSDSEDDDIVEVPFEPIVKNVESISLSDEEEIVTIRLDNIKKEKEEIKTENETKDVVNTEQRIDLKREKEVRITEKRTEKKPLSKDDDITEKEATDKKTEHITETTEVKSIEKSTDKKPQNKAALDVIEKRTDKCEEKVSSKHRRKKRKREDEGNRHKKLKHKIEASDSNKSSQKKNRHYSRDADSDFEVEKKERHRRKAKKFYSSLPTDNYYEEDYEKEIKKEYEDCTHPATSIEQEFPFVYGVYNCDICNLTLNSQSTYQSHITGKKHKKKLDAKNAAQAVAKSYVPSEPTSKCPNYNGTYDHANIPSTSSIQDHSFKKPSTSSIDQPITSKQGADFSELFKLFSHPDPSKAGFYCSICNSHSNSSSMWEAHISGKRHIANLKKAPGIAPSKSRNVPAPPGTVARLYSQLKNVYGPIVGLDQIREIQRLDNDSVTYTCFLCGCSSISEMEILDHIFLTKHREKYLEKINYPELETARNCQMSVRRSIIAELCERVEDEQGRGRPEVYYAKNSLVKM